MPESMWCHPGFTDAQSFTMALEELDKCMIRERLTAFLPLATNEKDKLAVGILRTLLHHVGTLMA